MKMSETIIADSRNYYYLFADFQEVNNDFYNLIIVDENDTPLYGYNIAGKRCVILPRNTRFKVVIPANSDILYTECDVEQIEDAITNINNIRLIENEYPKTDYVEGKGYMKSGTSLTFGSFGKHGIYSNIPENTQIAVSVENSIGVAYWYNLTDENDNILESYKSVLADFILYFGKYNQVTKLYISIQGGSTIVYQATSKDLHDAINDLKKEIDSNNLNIFSTLNIGIDGDSTTAQGGYYGNNKNWAYYLNNNLKFKKKANMAQGNAYVRDRTSNTSGTTYYPQWAPDAGESYISYFGLSDPNFAGDTGGKYESGTAEFDQATANNCFYSHVGYFIYLVNQGIIPKPDIFIFALAGINDLWTNDLQTTQDRIGNIDDAINTNWEDLERNTILKSLVWGIQRIRKEYPKCDLFFKTPIQQAKDSHKYFNLLYDPLIELLKYLSVKIIDTYAELGAQSDFESYNNRENNHYTSDGTHPTLEAHEKDGDLASNKIVIYYKY